MSTLTKPKYPLDKTGVNPINHISGEERKVDKEFNRAFAPYAGPFYGDSMKVYDKQTGARLVLGTDYQLTSPYVEATQKLGKPVYNLINAINRTYDNFVLDYQVPGGPYSYSIDAIVKLINDLQQDDRVVSWGNIWGKPTQFNPSPHLHSATDLYSLEYVVLALEEMTRAIIQGDVASHNVLYDYINRVRQQLQDQIDNLGDITDALWVEIERLDTRIDNLIIVVDAIRADLTAHINDKNNPHNTTKAQVGLGSVENYRIATEAEAIAGASNILYMTPWLVARAIAVQAGALVDAHANRKDNPHTTTKAQVGLGSVENYGIATTADAQAGTSNILYMTPSLVAAYSTSKVLPIINNHIARIDNPHGVTKAQVGLGNVQNYGIASSAEAIAGGVSTSYVVPRNLVEFRNGFQTYTTAAPSTTAGYREGHFWYQLKS